MDKSQIKTLDLINEYNVNINTVPAVLRKCKGFILEAVTVQPHRTLMFYLMEELEKKGYYVYSLRHKENDMSEPHYVTNKKILVNRFGWFISKDKMKFKKKNDEIRLNVNNSKYFNTTEEEIIEELYYGCCRDITVHKYFENINNY